MRTTYQLSDRLASALKGAIEGETKEAGIDVRVNLSEVSELSFEGIRNPSQHIQEFFADYGINDIRVRAVGNGVYSVDFGKVVQKNRVAGYLDEGTETATTRRKKSTRSGADVQLIHDNLFESAGRDSAVDQELYAAFK